MCCYDEQNKNKAEEKSYRIWAFISPSFPPAPNNVSICTPILMRKLVLLISLTQLQTLRSWFSGFTDAQLMSVVCLMGRMKHSINKIQAVSQRAVLSASFLASLKLCWWLCGCLLVVTPKHLKYLLLSCRHSRLIKFRTGGRPVLGI